MHQALFLNYHSLDIGRKSEIYHVDQVYSVREADFAAQIALIATLKIPVISLAQYLKFVQDKAPLTQNCLVITFDDGFLTDYETAYPILKKYGFPATFFICLRNIKSTERWVQMREMQAAGYSFGSHTVTHPYLSDIPLADLRIELQKSKEVLEQNLGSQITWLAPPGGRFNKNVLRIAKELGYQVLASTRIGLNNHLTDTMALKRWTVRYNTTLPEFEKMIKQDAGLLRKKIIKAEVLNMGKKLLGNNIFDKIRDILLPPQT